MSAGDETVFRLRNMLPASTRLQEQDVAAMRRAGHGALGSWAA